MGRKTYYLRTSVSSVVNSQSGHQPAQDNITNHLVDAFSQTTLQET